MAAAQQQTVAEAREGLRQAEANAARERASRGVYFREATIEESTSRDIETNWEKFKGIFSGDKKDPGLEFDIMKSENGFVEIIPTYMFILSTFMWIFLIVGVPFLWYTQRRFYDRLSASEQESNGDYYSASMGLMVVSMIFLVSLSILYLYNYGKKSFIASRTNVARLGARINSKLYGDASGSAYYRHAAVGMTHLAQSATNATNAGLMNYHIGEAVRAAGETGASPEM